MRIVFIYLSVLSVSGRLNLFELFLDDENLGWCFPDNAGFIVYGDVDLLMGDDRLKLLGGGDAWLLFLGRLFIGRLIFL